VTVTANFILHGPACLLPLVDGLALGLCSARPGAARVRVHPSQFSGAVSFVSPTLSFRQITVRPCVAERARLVPRHTNRLRNRVRPQERLSACAGMDSLADENWLGFVKTDKIGLV
jgi:hypothetical protein